MSIQAINHVQLPFPAEREAPMRHFYGALLGMHELQSAVDGFLRYAAGGQRIDLVPTGSRQAPPAALHLAFEVEDLPALRSRLLQAELPLVENRGLPGFLRFYVKDPAGNQLEFLEPAIESGDFS